MDADIKAEDRGESATLTEPLPVTGSTRSRGQLTGLAELARGEASAIGGTWERQARRIRSALCHLSVGSEKPPSFLGALTGCWTKPAAGAHAFFEALAFFGGQGFPSLFHAAVDLGAV